MSSAISTLLILGLAVGAGIAIWKRCDWFGMCGDLTKDITDTINAVSAGGLTSISSGEQVAAEIKKQGIQHVVATDPKSKLAAAGPLTHVQNKGLVPVSQAPKIGAGLKSQGGVIVGTTSSCQAGSHDDGNGGCVLNSGFARAMSAMTVTGERMSYF